VVLGSSMLRYIPCSGNLGETAQQTKTLTLVFSERMNNRLEVPSAAVRTYKAATLVRNAGLRIRRMFAPECINTIPEIALG